MIQVDATRLLNFDARAETLHNMITGQGEAGIIMIIDNTPRRTEGGIQTAGLFLHTDEEYLTRLPGKTGGILLLRDTIVVDHHCLTAAQCYNCHTTATPHWRKDDEEKTVCNA